MKGRLLYTLSAVLILTVLAVGCTQQSPTDGTPTPTPTPSPTANPELPYGGRVITDEMPTIAWSASGSFDGSLVLDFWSRETEPFIIQINSATGELEWYYTLNATGLWLGDSQRLSDSNYMFMSENGIYVVTPEGECVWFHYAPFVSHHCEVTDRGVLVVSAFDDHAREISWDHETLWEWKAENYIQHYTASNYVGLKKPRVNIYALTKEDICLEEYTFEQWLHMNSAQRLPDGTTILSLRVQDLVIQVDEDGNVIRSWGALTLKAQHTPVLDSQGRLWVFDNGNGRIVRFNEYGTVEWEYKGPPNRPLESVGQGGVELVNDGEFIIIADGDNRRVLIVNSETEEVVYTLQFEEYGHLRFYRAHYTE